MVVAVKNKEEPKAKEGAENGYDSQEKSDEELNEEEY